MALDETWRQRQAREIDDAGICDGNACGGAGRIDALAHYPDRPTLVHRAAVEDARRTQDDRAGFRLKIPGGQTGRGRDDSSDQRQHWSRWHAARIVTFWVRLGIRPVNGPSTRFARSGRG